MSKNDDVARDLVATGRNLSSSDIAAVISAAVEAERRACQRAVCEELEEFGNVVVQAAYHAIKERSRNRETGDD